MALGRIWSKIQRQPQYRIQLRDSSLCCRSPYFGGEDFVAWRIFCSPSSVQFTNEEKTDRVPVILGLKSKMSKV